MSEKLTLYYSVQNGGDGSAYPQFMESLELAEWDQDHASEGWGESCTGSITLESDPPITVEEDILTKYGYLFELLAYDPTNSLPEFMVKFFPNGFPDFTIEVEPAITEGYVHNYIIVGGKRVGKIFQKVDDSGEVLVQKIKEQIANI